ncbi:MAG: hypothetical protein PHX78_09650 [bacterium]|nr:hypothetical protein [bacterium]
MKIKIFLFLTIIMVCSGFSNVYAKLAEKELIELSKNIEAKLKISDVKKIAILEFANSKGDLPNVGNYIRNNLFDLFSESKDINVMLNRDINELLKEQKMSAGALADEKFIISILGVDAVVTGIITDFPGMIKINTKVTLKNGKLLAVYVTEIIKDENSKPFLDRIIQGDAYKESTDKNTNVYFNENFNTYKPNTVPENIGYGFYILQSENKNYITSNQLGERELIWKIDFPENFIFSFNFLPVSKDSRLDFSVIFVDEVKNEFICKFRAGGGEAEYILIPESSKTTVYFSSTNLNNIKFEKKKDIYKILLNDKETNFGIFTSFSRFNKVIIRADFSQGKFTDFQGTDLGR